MIRRRQLALLTLVTAFAALTGAAQHLQPHLARKGDRYALMVDGAPFFILGGQINNSSSWPATMPEVWPVIEGLHANTVEAPIYWEQLEPVRGHFDFSTVDMLLSQARDHRVHLVLLWFGSWKNGRMHYVPSWVKSDPTHFRRMIDENGQAIDVLSPNIAANIDADKQSFAALMHHLSHVDAGVHTVILVQVENESGALGAVRDHGSEAERMFEGAVPASLVQALHRSAGTWRQVFGPRADETFQAWSVARYVDQVAAAGKSQFDIPLYCNAWIQDPTAIRTGDFPMPGVDYPSGGPEQTMIDVWKAAAPHIDILGPDIYIDDPMIQRQVLATYRREDNPLWIPETGLSDNFAPELFYALGQGAIGFSPFGTDQTGWTLNPGQLPTEHAKDYALLAPIDQVVARMNFEGRIRTAVQEGGKAEQTLDFGRWQAVIHFDHPQNTTPSSGALPGRVLIGQLSSDAFLVTGLRARVTFRLHPGDPHRTEILAANQGVYEGEAWKPLRIWNGDQTDSGLVFRSEPEYIHIQLAACCDP